MDELAVARSAALLGRFGFTVDSARLRRLDPAPSDEPLISDSGFFKTSARVPMPPAR